MADNDKLPDALSARPLETGSKDMGGYFVHWRRGRNRTYYDIQMSETMDGKLTNPHELAQNKPTPFITPLQTTVYVAHSSESGLYLSANPHEIWQPSKRIN